MRQHLTSEGSMPVPLNTNMETIGLGTIGLQQLKTVHSYLSILRKNCCIRCHFMSLNDFTSLQHSTRPSYLLWAIFTIKQRNSRFLPPCLGSYSRHRYFFVGVAPVGGEPMTPMTDVATATCMNLSRFSRHLICRLLWSQWNSFTYLRTCSRQCTSHLFGTRLDRNHFGRC